MLKEVLLWSNLFSVSHEFPWKNKNAIYHLQISAFWRYLSLQYAVIHSTQYIEYAPRNIRDLFQDISNIHSYNTWSSALHNFYTQNSRLSIQLNSFSRIGTKIWNEMPQTLRNLSKHDFKRKIKSTFQYSVFGRLLSWYTKRYSKGQIFLRF